MQDDLFPDRPAQSHQAFVTLVTNNQYARGAAALIYSLKRTETEADCVVLHTDRPSVDSLERLSRLGARLVSAQPMATSVAFRASHDRDALHGAAPFTKGEKPTFHTPLDNFLKLRLWQLEEYQSIVFVDADSVALKSCDRLFAYPEFCAAPNVYETLSDFRRMNSGVFTARPSLAKFERMLELLDRPGAFWRRTDQTFLEHFFPNWHGLPIYDNMLQYVWLNLPALWDWDSIRILHFQYEKPWQAPHPKSDRLAPLISLWRAFDAEGAIPEINELPPPGVS